MKKCSKCGETKSHGEFHKNRSAKDGLATYCKPCACAARVANYRTAAGKAMNDSYGKRQREKNRLNVFNYLMAHPCVDCGESNPVVLEFDHRNPEEKSFTIGGIRLLHYSWKRVMSEIEKCDVRCANCHKKRTAEQFGWSKHSLYEEWKLINE